MTMQSSLTFEELCERYENCYEFMHDASEVFTQFDGVVGIGIGPKETAGKLNPDNPCFIIYVKEKKPMTELDANALIPREFGGVQTDVVAVGSRKNSIHNEFDQRWLNLNLDSFSGFVPPSSGGYRKAS